MVNSEKINLYLLSIVGIVAVVGIVILLLQSSEQSVWTDGDIAGQATSATCTDTDSGLAYTTRGTVSGGMWKTTGRTYTRGTDYCGSSNKVWEYYCSDATHAFVSAKDCATVVGADYVCKNGACIDADSDDDGLTNDEEATYGTDENDADSDNDGLTDYEEVMTYNTDPNDSDSDDDGMLGYGMSVCTEYTVEDITEMEENDLEGYLYLTDYEEVITYGTDPNDADSDDDAVFDGIEIMSKSDPNDTSDVPAGTFSVVCSPDCENGACIDADSDNDGEEMPEETEYS